MSFLKFPCRNIRNNLFFSPPPPLLAKRKLGFCCRDFVQKAGRSSACKFSKVVLLGGPASGITGWPSENMCDAVKLIGGAPSHISQGERSCTNSFLSTSPPMVLVQLWRFQTLPSCPLALRSDLLIPNRPGLAQWFSQLEENIHYLHFFRSASMQRNNSRTMLLHSVRLAPGKSASTKANCICRSIYGIATSH